MVHRFARATMFALLLPLMSGACRGEVACEAFCEDLGCAPESARCELSGECACDGCVEYYDAHFENGEPVGTRKSCDAELVSP